MRAQQAHIIAELNVCSTVDPAVEIRRRVDFLKDYTVACGTGGFVLGISGGQDSTLAGCLCRMAVTELVSAGYPARFVAVRLPYGTQRDEADAQRALAFIRPQETVIFNIKHSVDGLAQDYHDATRVAISDFAKGNVKARMRMIAQYALAGEHQLLVVGTDHAAEAVMGFFTKFGDGGADILPLTGLSKRQGRELLISLDAPPAVYTKVPTADLLDTNPGQSDEANLGLCYEDIDAYLEGHEVDNSVAYQIEQRFAQTRHKRAAPVSPFDNWWR